MTVNMLSWRKPWEALRAGRIDAQTFVDHGLQVRELLRRDGVNFDGKGIPAADLVAQFVVSLGLLEQMVCCGGKEGRYGFPTRDARFFSVSSRPHRWIGRMLGSMPIYSHQCRDMGCHFFLWDFSASHLAD